MFSFWDVIKFVPYFDKFQTDDNHGRPENTPASDEYLKLIAQSTCTYDISHGRAVHLLWIMHRW